MQFVITIVVGEAQDVFEVTQLLEPIAKIDQLKMVSVVPRPQGMVHQPLEDGRTVSQLPGAPMGPGKGLGPGVHVSVAPKTAAPPAEQAKPG